LGVVVCDNSSKELIKMLDVFYLILEPPVLLICQGEYCSVYLTICNSKLFNETATGCNRCETVIEFGKNVHTIFALTS
jgi:hypothetical protein